MKDEKTTTDQKTPVVVHLGPGRTRYVEPIMPDELRKLVAWWLGYLERDPRH